MPLDPAGAPLYRMALRFGGRRGLLDALKEQRAAQQRSLADAAMTIHAVGSLNQVTILPHGEQADQMRHALHKMNEAIDNLESLTDAELEAWLREDQGGEFTFEGRLS